MSSYLDHIPGNEREKIRRRMRSPEAYEALRDKVKGPEDLEREMRRNEGLAELRFSMESEPQAKEAMRKQVQEDLKEQGKEELLTQMDGLSDVGKLLLDQGRFDVAVDSDSEDQHDQLSVIPEGNVQEKVPLRPFFADKYVAQFVMRQPSRTIFIVVDGHLCGEVTLPIEVTFHEVLQQAKSHRLVSTKLRGRPIKHYEYLPGGILELHTK